MVFPFYLQFGHFLISYIFLILFWLVNGCDRLLLELQRVFHRLSPLIRYLHNCFKCLHHLPPSPITIFFLHLIQLSVCCRFLIYLTYRHSNLSFFDAEESTNSRCQLQRFSTGNALDELSVDRIFPSEQSPLIAWSNTVSTSLHLLPHLCFLQKDFTFTSILTIKSQPIFNDWKWFLIIGPFSTAVSTSTSNTYQCIPLPPLVTSSLPSSANRGQPQPLTIWIRYASALNFSLHISYNMLAQPPLHSIKLNKNKQSFCVLVVHDIKERRK